MAYFTLHLDERSIEEMLHDPAGPVGQELGRIAEGMTTVAKADMPFQTPATYSWWLKGSTSYEPWSSGWTDARTSYHPPSIDSSGRLFAGTDAPYAPTLWLEHGRKGRPMRTHRFMTHALDSASALSL